ncbi:hypothetical protein B0J13DRAFT_525202 [Dactylonectria estremocensis]|uniref:Uncharacterized protein n=1 Tax=Dactylonectria estremocensis TaxID=1079267 RepID=A0A9P9EU59_9HYPO|nr:hypothetical protein B0J13DRAFT_525202 [Dactylonectria estremocensis]
MYETRELPRATVPSGHTANHAYDEPMGVASGGGGLDVVHGGISKIEQQRRNGRPSRPRQWLRWQAYEAMISAPARTMIRGSARGLFLPRHVKVGIIDMHGIHQLRYHVSARPHASNSMREEEMYFVSFWDSSRTAQTWSTHTNKVPAICNLQSCSNTGAWRTWPSIPSSLCSPGIPARAVQGMKQGQGSPPTDQKYEEKSSHPCSLQARILRRVWASPTILAGWVPPRRGQPASDARIARIWALSQPGLQALDTAPRALGSITGAKKHPLLGTSLPLLSPPRITPYRAPPLTFGRPRLVSRWGGGKELKGVARSVCGRVDPGDGQGACASACV